MADAHCSAGLAVDVWFLILTHDRTPVTLIHVCDDLATVQQGSGSTNGARPHWMMLDEGGVLHPKVLVLEPQHGEIQS